MAKPLRIFGWTLLWLLVFELAGDIATQKALGFTRGASTLLDVLLEGESAEHELRRLFAPAETQLRALLKSGWLHSSEPIALPTRPSGPGRTLLAAYGQSFTAFLMTEVTATDPTLEVRLRMGPYAPLSHSFKLHQLDRGQHEARFELLGVMASLIPLLGTSARLTSTPGVTIGYTYPRYRLRSGKLKETMPPITSVAEMQSALANPTKWRAFTAFLAREDLAYDRLLFDQTLLDRSALGLLLRRALKDKHRRDLDARYHSEALGFNDRDGLVDVARALVASFAATSRADGHIPIVVLFHDPGYGDHLRRILSDVLARDRIPFIDSNAIAPTADSSNYLPGGHFTPAANHKLAVALLDLLSTLGR